MTVVQVHMLYITTKDIYSLHNVCPQIVLMHTG